MTGQTDMHRTARSVRRVLATVLNSAAAAASAMGYIRRRPARVRVWSGVVAAAVALGVPAAAQAQPATIYPIAGQQFTGVLGFYTESCARSTLECPGPGGATATINWGDGSPPDPNAQVAYAYGKYCNNQQVTCMFQVSGSHTYTNPGTYTGWFAWSDDSLSPTRRGSVAFTASVSVGPLPTTTRLLLPANVDTGWTAAANPARVTAADAVTDGTITITVNGVSFCSYSVGVQTGCTLANLPVGTDQVQASYSGSPTHAPSSASATVTVLPVDSSVSEDMGNWAGYAATGDTFTTVSASWTVPTANCGTLLNKGDSLSSSATWVGIDGDGSNSVEQIGTDSNCIPIDSGEYQAWWEMYPGGPTFITIPGTPIYRVGPGDVMSASVKATSTPGTYTLSIEDYNQGWTFATTKASPGAPGASAECIEEQPSLDFGLPPANLTNFGSVTFSQCMATGSNGIATPIWDHPNNALTMTDGATTKASVSPLSNDGTQFTVTWQHP